MELYVSEFSRYVIALLLVLYTYESFAVFRYREEERRKGIYFRQILLMFGFHLSSFLVICFETGDLIYLCFYAFQQIILYASVVLFKMLYPRTNRLVANNMCMLLSIGFVILTRLDLNIIPNSVLFPTPLPAKMPIRCPFADGIQSINRLNAELQRFRNRRPLQRIDISVLNIIVSR